MPALPLNGGLSDTSKQKLHMFTPADEFTTGAEWLIAENIADFCVNVFQGYALSWSKLTDSVVRCNCLVLKWKLQPFFCFVWQLELLFARRP